MAKKLIFVAGYPKYVDVPDTSKVQGYKAGSIGGMYTAGKTKPTTGGTGGTVAQAPQYPASTPAFEYGYEPAAMPELNLEPYKVNLPTIDWSFNPTEAQRGDWQTQATATAAQEIDPQLLSIQQALQAYLTQGQNQRNELNPRYTNQSLAIANVIKNSVKQEAIDAAIRRGAENSGWLTNALMTAGNTEAQQRGEIEAQRNAELNALAALEAEQTLATGQQQTALEKLRGQRITTALADLYNRAMSEDLAVKENQWNSALSGEQLRASAYGANAANQLAAYQTQAQVGMSNADRALQAAIAAAEQGNTQWNQQYQLSQDAYQRQLAASQAAQAGVSSSAGEPMYHTAYGDIPLTYAIQYGFVTPSGTATTSSAKKTTYQIPMNGQMVNVDKSTYEAWLSAMSSRGLGR